MAPASKGWIFIKHNALLLHLWSLVKNGSKRLDCDHPGFHFPLFRLVLCSYLYLKSQRYILLFKSKYGCTISAQILFLSSSTQLSSPCSEDRFIKPVCSSTSYFCRCQALNIQRISHTILFDQTPTFQMALHSISTYFHSLLLKYCTFYFFLKSFINIKKLLWTIFLQRFKE